MLSIYGGFKGYWGLLMMVQLYDYTVVLYIHHIMREINDDNRNQSDTKSVFISNLWNQY